MCVVRGERKQPFCEFKKKYLRLLKRPPPPPKKNGFSVVYNNLRPKNLHLCTRQRMLYSVKKQIFQKLPIISFHHVLWLGKIAVVERVRILQISRRSFVVKKCRLNSTKTLQSLELKWSIWHGIQIYGELKICPIKEEKKNETYFNIMYIILYVALFSEDEK